MQNRKKEIERYHLELFRETRPDFPLGSVIDSEEPDFLIENSGTTILGVEVTELYREPPAEGRPMQAWENLAKQIVEEACAIHTDRGGPTLTVRVEFDLASRLRPARRSQVALKLAELVLSTDIDIDGAVRLENHHEELEEFPEEITRIRIQRSRFRSRPLWSAPRAAFIPRLSATLLQERINEKNKRTGMYRRKSLEVWLVIVHNLHFSLASSFENIGEAVKHNYHSQFDRTFILDAFGKRSEELITSD